MSHWYKDHILIQKSFLDGLETHLTVNVSMKGQEPESLMGKKNQFGDISQTLVADLIWQQELGTMTLLASVGFKCIPIII